MENINLEYFEKAVKWNTTYKDELEKMNYTVVVI
jgi:hypothetical protein